MGTELKIWRDYIERHSMRYTPERENIVREIFSRHDHFTIDNLHLRMHRNKRPVSRASLYRTLPLLIDAGLVAQVFQDEGQTYYEHTYGHEHHCHLRCLSCGQVVEFAEPILHQVEDRLADELGFEVKGHRLEVMGFCPSCRKNKENLLPDRDD